ncbi:MAG: hypothetical protein LRY73_04185 [Bacillus sp. (in: Bacteria)]|nr:hypothetical protein [Bacillus sp. (in: firmicutes)]
MNIKSMTSLAIRILAVYVIVQALKNLPMFVSSSQMIVQLRDPFAVHDGLNLPFLIAGFVPFLVLLGVALFLWIKAEAFVTFIGKKTTIFQEELSNEQFSSGLQITAFSVVGLIVLVNTVPQLFNVIPSWLLTRDQYGMNDLAKTQTTIYTIGLIVQMAIGFYLFFGSKGLAGILKKVRDL